MTTTTIKTAKKGFTLLEILIAVSIVGTLLAIFGPMVYRQLAQATTKTARLKMDQLKGAINLYHADTQRYPTKLIDLVKKPADPKIAAKWTGPYVEEDALEDPWGQTFRYKPTPGTKHPYELYTMPEDSDERISAW